MIKWLQEGLEGRTLKATLFFYIFGVIVLAPFAALIALLFNAETAFKATPFLAVVLVGIEYSICYLFPATAPKKDNDRFREKPTFSKNP